MTNAALELQTTLYAALSGDSTLSAMTEGVFNHVPQGTDYPYVVISNMGAEDISSVASHKERLQALLNVYSDAQGAKEALDIACEIHRVLHQQSFSMNSGYILELLQVRETNARQLSSGKYWLVQVRVEARIKCP